MPFSADEIHDLIRVAPDIRLANYFMDGSRFIATERGDDDATAAETIHRGATCSVLEAVEVLRVVEESLKDEIIDLRERVMILSEIGDAEQALAALRQRLKQGG